MSMSRCDKAQPISSYESLDRVKGHLLAEPRKSVVTLWLLRANRTHVVHKATTSGDP